ncbi:MAG: S-methyl-5'-thioadenosine phosphorylase [Thermoanaerobaculia bacterium]|nr:S-methyl-5'-thioadenosine phosphorylase [Thermoanaerobaculia bacterium]
MSKFTGSVPIGVIGGSGLYTMDSLEVLEERVVETPFGQPSDALIIGRLEDLEVAFLSRHGRGHRLMPSELPFRANIWAMKSIGVRYLISVSAVGSLQEAYAPRHVVVPDQFIDRTRHRPDTFFGDGLVAHVGFADPVCPVLTDLMADAAEEAFEDSGSTPEEVSVHRGGTYVCMEGPQFSTRAESFLYRSWGADIIGMTNLQEAKLAREAEICYGTFGMVTDYDCWHETEEDVTVEAVLEILRDNAATGQAAVRGTVRRLAEAGLEPRGDHTCPDALRTALITQPDVVPAEAVERLRPILGRYFSGS